MFKLNYPVCFLFVFFLNFGFSQGNYSYKKYVQESKILKELQEYYFKDSLTQHDLNTLVLACNKITFQSLELRKHRVLYMGYNSLGDSLNALEHFQNMILLGHDKFFDNDQPYLTMFSYDSLIKVRNEINDTAFFADFKKINNSFITTNEDGAFVMDFSQISTARKMVDSLVSLRRKWIGYDYRGNQDYKKDMRFIKLLYYEMSEQTSEIYLDTIIANCSRNNEDWVLATSIKYNQISNFGYGDSSSIIKLRKLAIGIDSLNYEDNNTCLTVHAIARYMEYKGWKKQIRISPTELWGGSDFHSYLISLRNKLAQLGVNYYDIILNPTPIKMDPNEHIAQDYLFVFEIIEPN